MIFFLVRSRFGFFGGGGVRTDVKILSHLKAAFPSFQPEVIEGGVTHFKSKSEQVLLKQKKSGFRRYTKMRDRVF